jgi:hypothetical protein
MIDRACSVPLGRPARLICVALCVAQGVYLAASLLHGDWIVGRDGQLIATDFLNIWASGRQVLEGEPAAAYDVAGHKEAEVAAIGHSFAGQYPWLYPPTFFFVVAPLALLPFVPAYIAWAALTFPAYLAPVRAIIGHRLGFLLACAYPGILSNLVVGQNGFATAGLIGGSLVLLERSPVLAGCCIGLLSFKPHLGILFPVAMIAGGYWRAMLAAAIVVLMLSIASALVFGLDSWCAFLTSLPVASQSTLIEGRADWAKLQSVFGLLRLLGASAAAAWTVHCTFTGIIAVVLWKLWRTRTEFELKAAALATAALLATPYLFIYDLVVLAIAMAFLIRLAGSTGYRPGEELGLGMACLLILIFPAVTAPVGLAAILLVGVLVARRQLAPRPLPSAPSGLGRAALMPD